MTSSVADIFGRSPVMPLEKHMQVVFDCAAKLPEFFAAAFAGDWDRAAAIREEILALEARADGLKRDIRLGMPRRLFMPFPREELLRLLKAQDAIANQAKYVANIVLARQLTFPAPLQDSLVEFVRSNLEAAAKASTSIHELDELSTTGFRGSEAELVNRLIDDLDEIESRVEQQHFELQRQLYAQEASVDAANIPFLYNVVELIAQVGYQSEQVGRRLELLLSR